MPVNPPTSRAGSGSLSGVTVSGVAAAGQVPVASSAAAGAWAYPPGFEIGYDQITATVNIASSTEAAGTTIITCGAHTFDGAAVIATFFSPQVAAGTSGSVVSLFEGATQIGEFGFIGNAQSNPFTAMLRFTPSAASHTYTVTAFALVVAGGPSVQAGAGGTGAKMPAFIRFTKV